MFDVDKSNGMRKATSAIDEKYLKKVGALMVSTMLLLSPLKAKAEEPINTGYSDFEMKQYEYIQKVMSLEKDGSFDQDLVEIYNFYDFVIDGKKINISRLYLAFGYDKNNNFIVYIVAPALGNYDVVNNCKYNLKRTSLVQLRQTTLFITLLREGLIEIDEENELLSLSNRTDEINTAIENWDWMVHDLVPDTSAYDEKKIIKK